MSETKYSPQELIDCICQCMSESLPAAWKTAHMQADVDEDAIDATFKFVDANSAEEQAFQPENFIAALNAARELQALMSKEGNGWDNIIVKIEQGGSYEVFTRRTPNVRPPSHRSKTPGSP